MFEDDYANKRKSGNFANNSVCGWGSETAHTRDMIVILHSVVNKVKTILGKNKISFLDSSCGDMFWMPEFLDNRMGDVDFTGYDLSQGNIDNNKEKYGSRGWTFKVQIVQSSSALLITDISSNMTLSKTASIPSLI